MGPAGLTAPSSVLCSGGAGVSSGSGNTLGFICLTKWHWDQPLVVFISPGPGMRPGMQQVLSNYLMRSELMNKLVSKRVRVDIARGQTPKIYVWPLILSSLWAR